MAVSFSIVVPVYNKSKYLRQCIESILAQSHNDFEIIAVDDGSSDDSLEILRSYDDPRLQVYSIPNGGVSNARNVGISHASKEYLTFVDGDDSLASDYLERFSDEIKSNQSDVIIGGLKKIKPNGEEYTVCCSCNVGLFSIADFKKLYISQLFENEGIFGYVAAKFVKRNMLTDSGVLFNPHLKLAEDLDFWARVYIQSTTISIVDYSGYQYAQETENSSIFLSSQQFSQIKIWLDIMQVYAKEEGVNRIRVLRKINGILEAHMLELQECSFAEVKSNLVRLLEQIKAVDHELQNTATSILQRLIVNNNPIAVWLYLQLRKTYHRFH